MENLISIKTCDRCKKKYQENSHNVTLTRSFWYEGPATLTYNICSSCEEEFDNFMMPRNDRRINGPKRRLPKASKTH